MATKCESEMTALCFGATDVDRASPSLTAVTVCEVNDGSTGPLFTAFALGKASVAWVARRYAHWASEDRLPPAAPPQPVEISR